MTETTNAPNGQYPAAPPTVETPIGPISTAEAEFVLRGLFALEPDYLASLLVEFRLGRQLDTTAIAKARKVLAAATKTADPDRG